MSEFTEPLIAELVGRNLWKVYKDFEYHIGTYPSEEIIKVPVGFITNFASVPRIFWSLISPVDNHGKAAVVHDFCYATQYTSKRRCDDIFYEGLRVLNVPKFKAVCMYWAVRIGGWFAWYRWKRKAKNYK